jgi:heme/copper-type cytochrome/quinol oxidase subunit 2
LNSNIAGGFVVAVLALALVLGGLGAGIVLSGQSPGTTTTVTTTKTATSSATDSSPYTVTLVIATDSIYNSTAQDQPAYFLLGPNGLESSANITLPANRLIKLVIINYDDGNATLNQFGANLVSGTSDGKIFVASNDNINSSEGPSGIVLNGGQSVSSVPSDGVAHTFTVPSLNLNIPVPMSSTVVAYFTISRAGNYAWFCLTACGDAAMTTAGWMTGNLAAS